MAIVNIDRMVEIIRPAVGIGVDVPPIILGKSCTEVIVVRFLRTSSCGNPKRGCSRITYMALAVIHSVLGDICKEARQTPQNFRYAR
jgi:hypothetical protein